MCGPKSNCMNRKNRDCVCQNNNYYCRVTRRETNIVLETWPICRWRQTTEIHTEIIRTPIIPPVEDSVGLCTCGCPSFFFFFFLEVQRHRHTCDVYFPLYKKMWYYMRSCRTPAVFFVINVFYLYFLSIVPMWVQGFPLQTMPIAVSARGAAWTSFFTSV